MGLAPSAIKSEKVQMGGEAAIFTVTIQKQGFFDFFYNNKTSVDKRIR